MSIVVDSHHHLWDRSKTEFDYRWQESEDLKKICRTFLPQDLEPEIRNAGVDKTVLVQTQHNLAENHWALELADQNEWIAGVVGWVDLASPECESQVEQFSHHPKFVGVRHVVQDETDDNFVVGDDVLRGLAVLEKHKLTFDLLFFVKHLRHASTLARRFPNLRLVIDHLAKPKIKARQTAGWLEDFIAASRFPNVFCKLSGMVTEADWDDWTAADLRPYIDTALDCFGVERCMFGSDWPVCGLAASYREVVDVLLENLGEISESERQKIMGDNATEFYGLNVK